MNLNDFGAVYLLNLDRRPDRLDVFRRMYGELDWPIPLTRVSAVDGTTVDVPPKWGGRGPGAWGCLLSHKMLFEVLVEQTKPVFIFEDDAEPLADPATLRAQLDASLAELPPNWEQFYLGCEHLFSRQHPPERVAEHLIRPWNANRTHAYAITPSGAKKMLDLIDRWEEWKAGWHIDWAMGSLHEVRAIETYCAWPHLFGQAAGVSDIDPSGRTKQMHWRPFQLEERRCGPVRVLGGEVGWGNLSVKLPTPLDGAIYHGLFAHAPSEVDVEVTEPVEVFAFHPAAERGREDAEAVIDGERLGAIRDRNECTGTRTLEVGRHQLEFRVGDNRAAHTYWIFRPLSVLPFRPGSTFEIYTNSKCPRRCQHCNQHHTMRAHPEFEYTPEDAQALVDALTEPINLVFSGGEPALIPFKTWDSILDALNSSEQVRALSVTTSDDTEEWLSYATERFNRIHLSHRPSMDWTLDQPPLRVVQSRAHVWNTDFHHPWPEERQEGVTRCCCTNVKIHAAIFGQEVRPCILGLELLHRGHQFPNRSIPLADYFSGKAAFTPIGLYEACRWCVNNDEYRRGAPRVLTAKRVENE